MAKLDLQWLEVFVEVYKTQSVSLAAERLGIAQANASVVLGKLRHYFGDRLFSRTSRGMEPTLRAAAIYPDLRQALDRLEAARGTRETFDPARTARKFRLCITDISEVVLLPRLLNHLRQVAPQVSLSIDKISGDSARHLEAGDVDLAIGFVPSLEAGFYQQTLFSQDFVCLAAQTHPRIQGRLGRRAFGAEGHIVVTSSGTGHSIVEKVLARKNVRRRVALEVPSFLGVARIVAQTELLVIVPRLLGETLATQEPVQILPPPVALPTYRVKQHWHERFHADSGSRWLRATTSELFAPKRGEPQHTHGHRRRQGGLS